MKNQAIFFFALTLFFVSVSANETRAAAAAACNPGSPPGTVCLNQPCAQLGQTTMDGDQKHIIACLLNDAGTSYVWKSMSAVTDIICPANKVLVGINNGLPVCKQGFGGIFQTHLCDGTCRIPNPLTGACSCPSGFNAKQINDWNGACSDGHYENLGMLQFACY